MSHNELIDFEKDYPEYEAWYANRPPKEIREKIGYQIIYVDYVDPYRGTYQIRTGIIPCYLLYGLIKTKYEKKRNT